MEAENDKKTNRLFAYSTFIYVIILLGAAGFYFWRSRIDLTNTNSQKIRQFYAQLANSQVSFTDAGEIVFPDENKFLSKKSEYIKNKENFVEADLKSMKLTLYESGSPIKTFDILTKGKEGSWWETPTGNYKVLGKSTNAFSSIGHVWMPYSIQFYGNYFIHGWPYYEDGRPVSAAYSGGCIRLSTEDAEEVFNFAKAQTPILVLEDNLIPKFGMLKFKPISIAPANVSAKSFLIADLSSGEAVLEKMSEERLPVASLTKLMTAVVAHEVIYLGRSITVTPSMTASAAQVFQPIGGQQYTGLDLLYPLLMQSSNESAKVLSGYIGQNNFIKDMNMKAASLQMSDTQFADPAGISAENVSTAGDLFKLLQYIYYKRPFIFEISKGVAFENVGTIKIGETIDIPSLKNFNEFVSEPDLIGVKNGETTAAKQTMATVWNIHTKDGDVPIAIIILGSDDRKSDTQTLLAWVQSNLQ